MIAKTREDVPSIRNSMVNVTKTGPIEKPGLSKGLGSRGGLLTKKSTMNNMLPKRESTRESVKVLRGQMGGGDRPVPNKVEDEPTAAADYTDGRDPEEKRRDEQRQERLDRIYELNKRLRQGGSQSRKFSAKASNFSTSVFEASSTLRTISTAPSTLSSTYSANIPTPKIDKERGNYTLDVQPQQAIPEAKDPSDLTDQHQDLQLCPEIPPGLQVLVPQC